MKKIVFVLIAFLTFAPAAFAVERAWVSIEEPEIVPDGLGGFKTVGGYRCAYAALNFQLDAIGSERIELKSSLENSATPATLNDLYQQECMNRINADFPGTISNKNDIRVKGAWTK